MDLFKRFISFLACAQAYVCFLGAVCVSRMFLNKETHIELMLSAEGRSDKVARCAGENSGAGAGQYFKQGDLPSAP